MTDAGAMLAAAREYVQAGEPRIVGPDGGEVESFVFPLGRVSNDLADTRAVMEVRNGALLVIELEPKGDPAFRATPNAAIEHALREAVRTFRALSESPEGFIDADGRRLRSRGVFLYPVDMRDAPPRGHVEREVERKRSLALAAGVVVAIVLGLVAADLADPIACIAIPAPLLYAWALMRDGGRARALHQIAPTWADRLGRARAQAQSIAAVAHRARGLGA